MNIIVDDILNFNPNFKVFPCRKKQPVVDGGFYAATRDKNQIQKWIGQFPNCQWGLRTGIEANLFILDVDGKEGFEALKPYGELPRTRVIETSPGRFQYYFNYSSGLDLTIGQKIFPSVDYRGEGGYAIGWGCIHHETGKPYKVYNDSPVVDVPQWLIDLLKSFKKAKVRKQDAPRTSVELNDKQLQASQWLNHMPGSQQGRGADKYCSALAVNLMWGFDLTPEEAIDIFWEWGQKDSNVDKNGQHYPWTNDQLERKLEWARDLESDEDKPRGWKLRNNVNVSEKMREFYENLHNEKTKTKTQETKSQGEYMNHYAFKPMSAADFDKAEFKTEWLIKDVLVKNQPCIMGGPKKSLKTSILVEAGISLGSGLPFLDKFPVARKFKTLILSGESGAATLQETARRIAKSKGTTLSQTLTEWDFALPRLSNDVDMAELAVGLNNIKPEVVIIDPLYLCLLAGSDKSASNLYDMGPLLYKVSHMCLRYGATPILCHHTKKHNNTPNDPTDLEDLSFSGVQEFARQWILINRRVKYELGSGLHQLWLSIGGSAGHSGLWGVDVEEGQLNSIDGGRKWKSEVLSITDIKKEKETIQKKNKEMNKHKHDVDAQVEIFKIIRDWTSKQKCSANQVRLLTGFGVPKFNRIVAISEDEGYIIINDKMMTLTEKGISFASFGCDNPSYGH